MNYKVCVRWLMADCLVAILCRGSSICSGLCVLIDSNLSDPLGCGCARFCVWSPAVFSKFTSFRSFPHGGSHLVIWWEWHPLAWLLFGCSLFTSSGSVLVGLFVF